MADRRTRLQERITKWQPWIILFLAITSGDKDRIMTAVSVLVG